MLAILINDKPRRLVIYALSLAVATGRIGTGIAGEFSFMWKFGLSDYLAAKQQFVLPRRAV